VANRSKGPRPPQQHFDAIRAVARHRRNYRQRILPFMSDQELDRETDYLIRTIRLKQEGVQAYRAYRLPELVARLRAASNEKEARKNALQQPA
jgi:hypothetical protein